MTPRFVIGALLITCLLPGGGGLIASGPPPGTITLNAAVTHQTIHGWEATAQAGQIDEANHRINPQFSAYADSLFTQAVNDLGLTRMRLEITSGIENTTDYFQQWLNGSVSWTTYLQNRYAPVNDNGSPTSLNTNGFKWTALDTDISLVVNPFRAKVLASGQTPYINLCYVDFAPSAFKHSTNVTEYGEFMLAAFQHIQSTFGWVPNAIEISLEPDNTSNWTASAVGNAIVAVKNRLAAAGFSVDIIAPSTTNLSNAITYFDAMIKIPGVAGALKEVSYHLYAGNNDTNRLALASRAATYGFRTSMLEWIGATHKTLHSDLTQANVSAWQQYTLAYPTADTGAQYYTVSGQTVTLGNLSRYLRQYFRYLRPGAVRIDASSDVGSLSAVAVINPTGRYAVVVEASSAQSITIAGLPPGRYGIRYTTSSATDVNPGDYIVGASGMLSTGIPAAGVLTVFGIPDPPPGPFTKTAPVNGASGLPMTLNLSWGASQNAAGYEYCVDSVDNGSCDAAWWPAGASLNAPVGSLMLGTPYYWQVRAGNASGAVYADGGTWWNFSTPPPGSNVVINGSFATGLTGWQTFAQPDPNAFSVDVIDGVLRFYRHAPPPGSAGTGVVLQSTGLRLQAGDPVVATFEAGNSSTVRKRLAVLVHDQDFLDLSFCTYWLPPGAPLRSYRIVTHTTRPWANATISFYAATAGPDSGYYHLDNVTLTSDPAETTDQTRCIDPLAPVAPGGPSSADLVRNGSFAEGAASWIFHGSLTAQLSGGVLEFARPLSEPAGVVLQPTNEAATADQILTATFELGNSSSVRKRLTVLLHDFDWGDLAACTFWLEPGQPLVPYQIRAHTTVPWMNATLAFYPSTTGSEGWYRLDNVSLLKTPATPVQGTECLEPSAGVWDAAHSHSLAAERRELSGSPGPSVSVPTARSSSIEFDRLLSMAVTPGSINDLAWVLVVSDERGGQVLAAPPIDLSERHWTCTSLRLGLPAWAVDASLDIRSQDGSWRAMAAIGVAGGPADVRRDLSAFVGQRVLIQLRIVTDGDITLPLWWVDDVRLECGPPALA